MLNTFVVNEYYVATNVIPSLLKRCQILLLHSYFFIAIPLELEVRINHKGPLSLCSP